MSVESVLELIASGMETSEIIKEYPFLTREQIQAAVDYAAKILKNSLTILREDTATSYLY